MDVGIMELSPSGEEAPMGSHAACGTSALATWRNAMAVLAVLGLFGSGCAGMSGTAASTATDTSSAGQAPVETMSPGWQSKVTLHWRVVTEGDRTQRVRGYIQNESPERYRVRIIVKSLDASGAVTGRRVQQMFGELQPFERDFFDVTGLPAADRYEVGVYTLEKVPGLEG
jgi:hypothetical protein